MRVALFVSALVLLFGCGVGVTTPDGPKDDESPTPTDTPAGVHIDEIVPADGPRGSTIEIHGSGFGTDAATTTIRWGSEEIQPETLTDTVITVIAPSIPGGGTVDVEVVNDLGSYLLPSAFTYRGGYGGVVTLEYLEYLEPDQFNPPGETSISTYAAFMLPEIDNVKTVVTGAVPMESCELNPEGPGAEVEPLDVGPQVELVYNSFVLTIPKNGSFYFPDNSTTDVSGYLANIQYDVQADGGSGEDSLASVFVADAVPTAYDFTVSAPALDGQPFNTVPKNQDLTFSWSTNSPGDVFQIQLVGYKLTGGADDGLTGNEVHCTTADDGSFTVSAADLAKLPDATHIIVLLSRRVDREVMLSTNQESTLESVGWHSKIGALEFQ